MSDARPILIHSFAAPMGGSERILLDLLHRLELDAVLACPAGPLADAAEASGVPVLRLRERPLEARGGAGAIGAARHSIAHGLEVGHLIEDLDPSMLVSWGMRAAVPIHISGVSARLRRGGRAHVSEHVDLLPTGRQGQLARRALVDCDRVICLSEAIAVDLCGPASRPGHVSVVHPGVSIPDRTAELPADPTALVLAAIEPWKGHSDALEAVARVPGLRLRIAGSPLSSRGLEHERRLRERAAAPDLAGRVEFTGTIDPSEALASSTLLLHPSPAEPFGRSMAEALASGRAVVACDAAGAREIVGSDCGRLVQPGDPGAMALALGEIAFDRDLASSLGSAGALRAAAMFDPDTQAVAWHRCLTVATDAVRTGTAPRSAAASALTGVNHWSRPRPGATLSIVTVIHDSAADLNRLLASVHHHIPECEVIVVDSGSSDGGPQLAAEWEGGRAKVIALDGNQGFGAGCVAGLAAASRPVTALVNPDVELIDQSIDRLARELNARGARPMLVSPLLIHPDGRRQDSVHPIPGTPPEMARAVIPAPLLPRRIAAWLEPHRSRTPVEVGWAVAACLIGMTATLRALGPFDPSVHLYAEDLDLALRAREAGIPTFHRPDARVLHREGHTTRRVFGGEASLLLARRRREVVRERLGDRALRRDDAIQALTHLDRFAIKRLLGRDAQLESDRLAALRDARRDR